MFMNSEGRAGFLRRAMGSLVMVLAGAFVAAGCGGGGDGGGTFTPDDNTTVSLSTTLFGEPLAANVVGVSDPCSPPALSCFITVEIDVRVELDLIPAGGGEIPVRLTMSPTGNGYLTRLDDPETEGINEFTGRDEDGDIVARQGVITETASESGGVAKFFYTSGPTPGPVTLTAQVTDPETGALVERRFQIEVGASGGSGDPTEILTTAQTGTVFTQGLNRPSVDQVDVLVLDEVRGAIRDPDEGTNNVLVEIVNDDSVDPPNAGEYLVGRNASGETMRGQDLLLPTRNGVAQFSVVAGSEPGFILIRATADGDDNNVDDNDNNVSNPVSGFASIVVTATGEGPPVTVESEQLPSGERLQPYATLLRASGGVPPYNWEVIGGRLPTGLSLAPDGVLSGTPTGLGEHRFVAEVRDSQSPEPDTARQEFEITIEGEPPGPGPLRITTSSLPTATSGESYAVALRASGGEPPYSWSLVPEFSGDWLQISESGILSSEDPEPGTFRLGLTVDSTDGQQVTETVTLVVEEGTDGGGTSPGDDEAGVGSIFVTGDNELVTGQGGELELQVVVIDNANRVMEDIALTPVVSDSDIAVGGDQITDEGGRALVTVRSPGSVTNRTVEIRFEAGGVTSAPFPIEVTGTRWERDSLTLSGQGGTVALQLVDGVGDPVPRSPTAYDFSDPVILINPPVQTGADGSLAVEFQANVAGEHSFDVTSAGALFRQFWTVADQTLRFLEPEGETFWQIGEDHPVEVRLIDGTGNPIDGETVEFVATRGTLAPLSATTNSEGIAATEISSDNIGPTRIEARVTVNAAEDPVIANTSALFVTTEAETVSLQAEPSVIAVEQDSRIIATVRDDEDQPVQGANVTFTVNDTTGGDLLSPTAETDPFGRAEVTYRAGSIGSSDAGVEITASVQRPDGTEDTDTVNLTVTAEALFITLGRGNEIRDVNDTTYGLPYTAVVTDSAGNPVTNRDLSLSLWSTRYRRGRWEPGVDQWVQNVTWTCDTEDPGRTGIYDAAQDVSGTGTLLPGNVASLVPDGGVAEGAETTIRTDGNGFANFEIRYPKDHAQWVQVDLGASVEVDGTEGTRNRWFWLPIAASDIQDLDVDPPGRVSPFGTGAPGAANGCIGFDVGPDGEPLWQQDQL